MNNGVLAGFPVVDVRAVLIDGSYHDVDSSVLAFQIAARAAFREGMKKAGAQLLEPIMKVGGIGGMEMTKESSSLLWPCCEADTAAS